MMMMMMNAEKARALVKAKEREEEARREENLKKFFAEKLEPMIEASAKEGSTKMRCPIALVKQYGEDLLPSVVTALRDSGYEVISQTNIPFILVKW